MTPPLSPRFSRPASPLATESPVEVLLSSADFFRSLSAEQRGELRNLQGERDPAMWGEALYSLAARMEQGGHPELALEIHRSLADSAAPQVLRARSVAQGQALLGQGPWQNRVERMGRNFVAQATDPAMIFAFGVAGATANLVRSGTMASLALRAPAWLTRGLAARAVSGTAAYLAEVPTFVAAQRVARAELHPEAFAGTWGEELAGAALFLGVMKLSGGIAEESLRGGRLAVPWQRRIAGFAQLGGIYTANWVQERAGLRRGTDGAGRFLDSLDTLFQMQVGGRLIGDAFAPMGPRLAAALEVETRPAQDRESGRVLALFSRGSDGLVMPERIAANRGERDLVRPDFPIAATEFEQAMRMELIRRHGRELGVGIIQSFEALGKLLGRPTDHLLRVGQSWLELEGQRLFLTLRRMRHAVQYSSADGLQGNYLNWLVRLSLEESLRNDSEEESRRLVDHLQSGAGAEDLESLVADQIPAFDLYGHRSGDAKMARDFPLPASLERSLQRMNLGAEAREVLARFLRYQGDFPAEMLAHLEARLRAPDSVSRLIEPTILSIRESPVAYLRMTRLLQILEHDPSIHAKLFELSDPRLRLWNERERAAGTVALLRSQEDGYLGELRWAEYLNQLQEEQADLRDPLAAMRRRDRTESVLRRIWPEPRPVTVEDLTLAMEQLGDADSLLVARALRDGRVALSLLDDATFVATYARNNGGRINEMAQAILIPAGEESPVDRLVLRQIHGVSDFVFRRLLRERLVQAVHEFDHHQFQPESPRSDLSSLREELPAHLRHIRYQAILGYPEELDRLFSESPGGPALFLRDRIEAAYFRRHIGGATTAAMAEEPGQLDRRFESLEGQSDYIHGLLNLAARDLDAAIPRGDRPISENFSAWLAEVDFTLQQFQQELTSVQGVLGSMERAGQPASERDLNAFRDLDLDFTRWRRVASQLKRSCEILHQPPTSHSLEEWRRRRDWLVSLGLFDLAPQPAPSPPLPSSASRFELGMDLLYRFLPHCDAEQRALFTRVARGPIRGRDIAFDLDKTLGDTFMRYLAQDAFRRQPEAYDVGMEDFVHQFTRMRLPYRGIQAMLLGLWAAGNRVRLYTASENRPGNHDDFFNDFPLLGVAMEIVPPTEPHRRLTTEDLRAAPHFMDKLKFLEFYERHFGTPAGQGFLGDLAAEQGLRRLPDLTVAKLPFPDFPFDVLVDDLYYFAGDLQTVGLGRRWILAEGNVPKMVAALERYFSSPLPEASPLWRRWLGH